MASHASSTPSNHNENAKTEEKPVENVVAEKHTFDGFEPWEVEETENLIRKLDPILIFNCEMGQIKEDSSDLKTNSAPPSPSYDGYTRRRDEFGDLRRKNRKYRSNVEITDTCVEFGEKPEKLPMRRRQGATRGRPRNYARIGPLTKDEAHRRKHDLPLEPFGNTLFQVKKKLAKLGPFLGGKSSEPCLQATTKKPKTEQDGEKSPKQKEYR